MANRAEVPRSRSQPRLAAHSTCALDTLPVQPVGMSDHYLERCYCYLCTCGEHCCPGDLKKSAAPGYSRGLRSQYRQEFTHREGLPPQPFVPLDVAHATGKMDLITTKQMHFKPPSMPPPIRLNRAYLQPTVKCVTRSSYQRDFPDWKPGEAVLFKNQEPPYRGNSLGFTARSTYQEEFDSAGKTVEQAKQIGRKRSDPIAVLGDFYGQTTNKALYQQPHVEVREVKIPHRTLTDCFESPPVRSFATTYRAEFNVKGQTLRIPFKQAARRLGTAILHMKTASES